MTAYRAGQRMRIEWPNGSAVEGTVSAEYDDTLEVGPSGGFPALYDLAFCDSSGTVTVLSEPRPDEPTGLGAVVRDRYDGLWVRTYRADGLRPGLCPPWREVLPGTYLEDDATRRHWDQIADPVVVHSEGWNRP